MINAYLGWVSSLYEGEDIEVRYCIYEDQECLCKESVLMEYEKPVIVGQVAFITLLKKLKRYASKEIVIIINDPALYEIARGTSTTNNKDVLKMVNIIKKELEPFKNIFIKDVSVNHEDLTNWNQVLQF